jgi:ABC-type glutathione transport system ATPase component
MSDIILKVENISFKVDSKNNISGLNSVEILKNISLSVERNKVIGIAGESGSGKSTFAKIISGVLVPTSGQIKTDFKIDWHNSNPKPIQILFQNDGNLINPYRKISDVLVEAYELKHNKRNDYSNQVKRIFNLFELKEELLNNKGSQLSGGEQQRIALARIIIIEPEILILDEPFSSQDVEAQLLILNLIKKIKEEFGLTIVCISHDLQILKHFADQIIIMYKGSIIENGITSKIFSTPQNEYTKFLINSQSLKLSKEEIFSFHSNYEQD